MRTVRSPAWRIRSPSSASKQSLELTKKEIRQRPGSPGLSLSRRLFLRSQLLVGRARVMVIAVYFPADARSPASSTGLWRVLLRRCEKAACHRANLQQPPTVRRGLPENSIAKNFASIITYPHSARTHFEN